MSFDYYDFHFLKLWKYEERRKQVLGIDEIVGLS